MRNIIDKLKGVLNGSDTVFIGIDGLGGAGKSTISEKLADGLKADGYNAVILHIDDFIHPKAVRYNDNYEEWVCYYNLQWRYDYLIENVVKPIKAGGDYCGDIELYNKENDTYFKEKLNVPPGTAVIIEGIFLQRPELDKIFDFMIYIDISEYERLERVLKRDGYIGNEQQIKAKYDNRYFPAERKYFSECKPCERADLVI